MPVLTASKHNLDPFNCLAPSLVIQRTHPPSGGPVNSSAATSTPTGHHHPQPFQVRNVKLDFPRFDSFDVLQWVFKAEQFFNYYSTPDQHRLTIAAVHMEKDVVPWFKMINRNHPFQSRVSFTRALEMEFGPSPYESPRASLFKLTQTNTVAEYYLEFTSLANRSFGITPDARLDLFISGLKPDLKRDVVSQTPTTMSKALHLAKLFEEKYVTRPKPVFSPPHTIPQPFTTKTLNTQTTQTSPTSKPTNTSPNPTPNPNPNPNTPTNVKRITSTEMQLRHSKGLCYYCDENWAMGHKFPNKHFLLM